MTRWDGRQLKEWQSSKHKLAEECTDTETDTDLQIKQKKRKGKHYYLNCRMCLTELKESTL